MGVFVCMRVCVYAHGGKTMGVFACMRVCVYAHGGKAMGVFACMCVWGLRFCVYGVCVQGQIFQKNPPSKKRPRRAFLIAPVAIFGPERPGAVWGGRNAQNMRFCCNLWFRVRKTHENVRF